jgi:hypothetical protein
VRKTPNNLLPTWGKIARGVGIKMQPHKDKPMPVRGSARSNCQTRKKIQFIFPIRSGRLLRWAFCLAVVLVAIWRFSENTVDPDLWGHVIFGQRMLARGAVERLEPFSWTAPGYPWVNHEVGAELAMGAAHRLMGGMGLFLLMFATGMFTWGLALGAGAAGAPWPERAAAWGIALLTAQEIAIGFAMRPQVFTYLFLTFMLLILKRMHAGGKRIAWILIPLFAVWINTHGGALAGFCLLGTVTIATSLQKWWSRRESRQNGNAGIPCVLSLWLALSGSAIALFCNPWGYGLLRWLVGSVMWLRPEISEWNPPAFGSDHLMLFALAPITALALAFSRRRKWLWETVVLMLLGVAALRIQRNIPLFCIAALIIVPSHLADAVERFHRYVENLRLVLERGPIRWGLAILLLAGAILISVATFSDKQKFYSIEIPRNKYPVTAALFIGEHGLAGNLLVSFDWGEFALWELPDCPVSIDGRLDTCYPHDLIREHWRFLDGRPFNENVFDVNRADIALLSTGDFGWKTLVSQNHSWTLAYRDNISVVLVRDPKRFSSLRNVELPVEAPASLLAGREPFPDAIPITVLRTPSTD